jgi:hypothetical protein
LCMCERVCIWIGHLCDREPTKVLAVSHPPWQVGNRPIKNVGRQNLSRSLLSWRLLEATPDQEQTKSRTRSKFESGILKWWRVKFLFGVGIGQMGLKIILGIKMNERFVAQRRAHTCCQTEWHRARNAAETNERIPLQVAADHAVHDFAGDVGSAVNKIHGI